MDYRSCIRLTRAMAGGEAAFRSALEASPDFEGAAFDAFAKRGKVEEWFTPLLDSDPARAALPAEVIAVLEETRRSAPARSRLQIDLCDEVQCAFAAHALPCLVLKGLAISSRFYGDPDLRHQFDADVLVHPEHCESALEVLAKLGFDAGSRRATSRQEKIQARDAQRAPQTVTVRRREKERIDLHVRTKSRWFHGIDESRYWAQRQPFEVRGHRFETLSDAHTLELLLVSIAADLRRGACRAKHFLDLYLVLRALDARWDFADFLDHRAHPNLRKTFVNVLGLLLTLWDCAEELPGLARAVARHRHLLELRRTRDALRLVDRRGRSVRTRMWYMRMGSRTRSDRLTWRYTVDLPRTLWRGLDPLRPGGVKVPWAVPAAPAQAARLPRSAAP